MDWQDISKHIESATGHDFKIASADAVAGGDINSAFRIQGDGKSFFIKLNRTGMLPMFEAEFDGLQELAKTQSVSVPAPVVAGQTAGYSFLVLENLEFGFSSPAASCMLGQQLALLHRQVQPCFGWHRDNTIGSTPQINTQTGDWPSFWREQRLGFQLKLAQQNGYGGRLQLTGDRLLAALDYFFEGYRPQPSLLHGDLWGGNSAVDKQGRPFIFDPACYYGDREADLAMTELFGGYNGDFYSAYQEAWPLDQGYKIRKNLYNLYHILNHLNLFGGGYLRQAENMIGQLLSEV